MTSYSQANFGKELNEVRLGDIRVFFAASKTESDTTEFKSYGEGGTYADKLKVIKKTICALLNSEGGIIIWGAPQGIKPEGQNEEVFSGDLRPIDRTLEKDRLINQISDSITPLPSSVNVRILNYDNNCVCIFEIGKSQYSPHQFDNRYFMRMDGQTRIAPHHYIEALFKKIKYPIIEGYLKLNQYQINGDNLTLSINFYIFNFSAFQNDYEISLIIMSDIGVFHEYILNNLHSNYGLDGHQYINTNARSVLHFGTPYFVKKVLVYNINTLRENGFSCRIMTSFGGKHSPMKSSDYKLSFLDPTDVNRSTIQNPVTLGDMNLLIIEKQENLSYYERQEQLGNTKQENLRSIIGR